MADEQEMAEIKNKTSGLIHGSRALEGFVQAQAHINRGATREATYALAASLEQLHESAPFWESVDYVIKTETPAVAQAIDNLHDHIHNEKLTGLGYYLLTCDRPKQGDGIALSKAHAIAAMTLAQPLPVPLYIFDPTVQSNVLSLTSEARQAANAQPGDKDGQHDKHLTLNQRLVVGAAGAGLAAVAGWGLVAGLAINQDLALVLAGMGVSMLCSAVAGFERVTALLKAVGGIVSGLFSGKSEDKPRQVSRQQGYAIDIIRNS